ncbi:MAG: deoxyribose-phosphate aldolase [Oscillospiraceae bacterium]|nr:deoxyribose-phosphate aldolase [Oscillospiraceae bacterium]
MKPFENLTRRELARMIDISAVRTQHGYKDIMEVASYGKLYHFINVHALPCWIKTLAEQLEGTPDVLVGGPCGFPGGAHTTRVKLLEAELMLQDGVQEMDIVMNVGKFKSGEYAYCLDEVKQIIALAKGTAKTKVLIELNCLTEYEADKACELVVESGADFLKTGTGWVPGDANVERIRRIKEIVKEDVKIKAAGGIRKREELKALYEMGVARFGINTASAIELVSAAEKE